MRSMEVYTFYVGTDREGPQQCRVGPFTRWARIRAVRRYLAKAFGGYTETPARGGWWSDGRLIHERSLAYTVGMVPDVDPDVQARRVEWVAGNIGRMLNQDAVFFVHSGGRARIYDVR